MWDRLWLGGPIATMDPGRGAWGLVEDGAVASMEGRIAWVGARRDLPGRADSLAEDIVDLGGRWLTPGLVDCHTHLVYGGNRAHEFALRLEGATYQEIAAKGGGIVSTVKATREASADELRRVALKRLEPLLAEGVTTIEVKSGYGLDIETEAKQLSVARSLAKDAPVTVSTTYLGLHAVPPEFTGRKGDFVDFVVEEALPEIAGRGLADAIDAFCETIAFTPDETARCFETARALGLPVKLHADQLSDTGGAALVARFGGLSADHVEYAGAEGIRAMAQAGTVAVILPAAFYYLRETKVPPIAELRRAGVPLAVASDINPGTAPVGSLLLMASMASTLFRMTPEEAFAGLTREAARALGMGGERGTITQGRFADFAIFDIGHPVELAYSIGGNPCVGVVKEGQPIRGLGAASQGGY